jgi:hypothetical protein
MVLRDIIPADGPHNPPGTAEAFRCEAEGKGWPSMCLPGRLFLQGGRTWWGVPVVLPCFYSMMCRTGWPAQRLKNLGQRGASSPKVTSVNRHERFATKSTVSLETVRFFDAP